MSTLLINGCSFAECWKPSNRFQKNLQCDKLVNLGKSGTSFQRTNRSTVEYIAQNGNPDWVIIPITFLFRWELAIGKKDNEIDGTWWPIQVVNHSIPTVALSSSVDKKKLYKWVETYYQLIPDIRTFWDKGFTEIITLASFLEQRKINYLMFDMCNNFEKKHLANYKGFEKIKLIEQNKKIIDLFNFCGNRYMWGTMDNNSRNDIDCYAHHHNSLQYSHLENKLIDYLQSQR